MKRIVSVFMVVILCFSVVVPAEAAIEIPGIEWQVCIGGNGYDSGSGICDAHGGGTVVAITTDSNWGSDPGGRDGGVAKIDSKGEVEWKTTIGGKGTDILRRIIQTSDGGYLAVGQSMSSDISGFVGETDGWIAKLNGSGELEWQRCYGGESSDFLYGVLEINEINGGFIAVGGSYSKGAGGEDFWVLKIDEYGHVDADWVYGGTGDERANSIARTIGSGYIITGFTYSDVSGYHGDRDVFVIKIDVEGHLYWQSCFGGSGDDYGNSIHETSDGQYILGCYSNSSDGDVSGNNGDFDFWIVKINNGNGRLEWEKNFGGSGSDRASSFQEAIDGGYVMFGSTDSLDGDVSGLHQDNPLLSPNDDFWLVKLNEDIEIEWQKCIGGYGVDTSHRDALLQTYDGGYMLAGTANSNSGDVSGNNGGSDCWVVKIKSVPVSGVSVEPAEAEMEIGDTQDVTATIEPSNATNKNVTWTSDNEAVATVDSSGTVTAVGAGTATITATTEDGGFTATTTVIVNEAVVGVTGVTVDPTSVTIEKGDTTSIAATVSPADATNKNVVWTSDNEAVATVDSSGTVTAVGAGTATITATTEDGGFTATTTVIVNEAVVGVTGVTVDPTSVTIEKGDTTSIAATVSPADATNKNVVWTSDNEAVATVDENGIVTAIGAGTATITATTEDGGYTATITVTVNVSATGVTVDPTEVTVEKGQTTNIAATVSPGDATNKNLVWTSDNEEVATVDENGTVTAVAAGTATITATTEDGGFTASCAVTVNEAVVGVTGVAVDPTEVIVEKGQTTNIAATVSPVDATNKNVVWTSDNEFVATVDENGNVTAIAAGTATITATTEDGGFTATTTVTVNVSATGVAVDPTEVTVEKGQTTNIAATVSPADATNKNVTWTSDNEAVATVDKNGTVTAVGAGTATITATTEDGGFTATTEITVNEAVVSVSGVTVDPTEVTVEKGDTTSIAATVSPADATNKNVTWTSDNESVATVDENGTVTAIGAGTATITATTEDGGFTATTTVIVKVSATGVAVDPTTVTIEKGDTESIAATVSPADATNKSVVWTSDNEAVATVDENGNVTAIGAGTATITATTEDGGFTASCTVTVNEAVVSVSGVTVDPTEVTVEKGQTTNIAATVSPADATNKNVVWTSDNEAVATVDENGNVTAIGAGTATITVTTEDGGFMASCSVTVNEAVVSVSGITADPTEVTVEKGQTTSIAATVSPADATNKNVTWTSDNESVATVDSNGTVTAVGAGTATITATTEDGSFAANCIVTVNEPAGMEPIDEIISAFDEAVDNGLIEGNGNKNKIKIFAGILDVGKRLIENGNNRVAIKTLESAYKFIDGKSNPKDLVVGEASGEIANMIKDLIESLNINVEGVSLDKTEITMSVREMVRLTATVEPSDAINKTVKWSTSNSRVASVSNTGRILARRPGTAVITVTTQDGGFQATCVVTVNP